MAVVNSPVHHLAVMKFTLIVLALVAAAVPFVWPLWNEADRPVSTAAVLVALVSTGCNLIVIFYHYAVPAHPKFLMIPWRRWILRVHITSGTIELVAGSLACFIVDDPLPGFIMAIAALCFHVPSAIGQTRIVFGSQAVMWPAYVMCIAMHAFCAIQLLRFPESKFWMFSTFLVFNVYVWCRVFMYLFDRYRIFEASKYTAAILAAGMMTIPFVIGPSTTVLITGGIAIFVLLYKWLFVRSEAEYLDFVREKGRDVAIDSSLAAFWSRSPQEEQPALARQFFTLLAGSSERVSFTQLSDTMCRWGLPMPVVETFLGDEVRRDGMDFDTFRARVWALPVVRQQAAPLVGASKAKSERDRAEFVFGQLDLDGDGKLGALELQLLLQTWGLSSKEMDRYLKVVRTDADGAVSFDSFFRDMRPVWRFIFYDVVEANARATRDMVGNFVSSMKAAHTQKQAREGLVNELLRSVPFLAQASAELIDDLGQALAQQSVPAGTVLFEQGAPGDAFYLVGSGLVSVSIDDVVVTQLGAGAYLGEGALLSDAPRSARAVCQSATSL